MVASQVHQREQEIAELFFDPLLVAACDGLVDLGQLFTHLVARTASVGPIETDATHLLAHPLRAIQSGQRVRHSVQHAALLVLFGLDRFPVREHLRAAADLDLAEYVRVATNQLADDAANHVIRAKRGLSPTELTEKHDLQREITELFLNMPRIIFVDRVDDFARLLQHVAAERLHVLLAIPRATSFAEKALHQCNEAWVGLAVLLGERQRFRDRKGSTAHGVADENRAKRLRAMPALARARLSGSLEFPADPRTSVLSSGGMESVLLIEREGPVATLIMNRPQTKNALDPELLAALAAGLAGVADDPSVRAVVLTGAGDAFCSGADLKGALGDLDVGADLGPRIGQFHALIRAIVHARKPVIAAVRGPAVGFGADLALACDLRVLSREAYLQEKFVAIGLMPDGGGSYWLPRLVGLGRALEYLLLGTRIDADLALQLGLANRVTDDERAEAQTLAASLAAGPPLALAAIKSAVRESAQGGIEAALEREKYGQTALLGSVDFREGVAAWAAKRSPRFSGK